ncbi:MAG: hypothetical protein J6K19_03810 [Prevotella sp.]|nr:hypothetical protein [Prevotella sp.]
METTDNFKAIKKEILNRARAAQACREQYGRAYASETLQELCNVIKDNFNWCCINRVLTAELLEQYEADFSENRIYVNTDAAGGYLLAYGNATVEAFGNAYCVSFLGINCRLSDNALNRVISTNTVYFANDNINFQKQ